MIKLSDKMQETYSIIQEHKKIVRWGECYWTYPNCIVNERNVPDWICQTSTLRALSIRGLIILDEDNNIASIK